MRDTQRSGIGAVERDTGISKDTLRVWERRYGFPKPERGALGERAYSDDDIERLRVIRRLLDAGRRPGKIVRLGIVELRAMAAELGDARDAASAPGRAGAQLDRFVESIRAHRVDDLRSALSGAALRMGLERFVLDVCAPLNRLVGEAWARGEFEVYEEHMYTESMQSVLRGAIGNIAQRDPGPRVLLTTLPGEAHGLGLLMAESLLALGGCHCTSLGTQTPVRDIVLAASAQRADIVALSVSASMNPNQVIDGLLELRSKLPDDAALWVGGGNAAVHRRAPSGVTVVEALAGIGESLARWRQARRP